LSASPRSSSRGAPLLGSMHAASPELVLPRGTAARAAWAQRVKGGTQSVCMEPRSPHACHEWPPGEVDAGWRATLRPTRPPSVQPRRLALLHPIRPPTPWFGQGC
jgi:hypothetical protein